MSTFTAADLKSAILGDEDYDEDGEQEYEGFDAIENGMYVPNPDYDPALAAEANRLWEAWKAKNDWLGTSEAHAALVAFRKTHHAEIIEHVRVPWAFSWNGVEYDAVMVEDNGGGEGSAEAVHLVFSVDGRLFRVDGSYYSYDGTTWDEDSFREVQAVVKEVTFYE